MVKKTLLILLCVVIGLGLIQSTFAVELNSTNITQAPFNCATSATSCNLSIQSITSIASGTFVNHSSLTSLVLLLNQITSIESGDFDGLTSLISLELGSNQITSIESGAFDGLTSLTYLELGNNQITSIESGDFDGLISLTALVLSSNQITSIESGDFDGLISLQELSLGSNQITSIESGDFDGLTNLTYLDLSYNCLNNEDIALTNYLDTIGIGNITNYTSQYTCITTEYNPSTPTLGSVTGSLVLRGPVSQVNILGTDNDMTGYDHIFTGNGIYLFDYTTLIDTNNYLWENNVFGSKTITGIVTWIIPPDTIAPIVTLSGANTLSLTVGAPYIELGATWTDNTDGSGIILYPFSGTVSSSVLGTYILSYRYIDIAGNTGNTVTRTVQVIPPIILPVSSGGGGGGSGLIKDNCPSGDYTNSYYDKNCGSVQSTTGGLVTTTGTQLPDQNTGSNTINNLQKAYEWALEEGITTVPTIKDAKLDTHITRAQLAKMLSVYSTIVLKKEVPLDKKACMFEDENTTNNDLVRYMRQACQLEIMGIESDGTTPLKYFQPNKYVSRAEFGTVLSRVLYGNTYNTIGKERRTDHLNALKKNNIITVIDPTISELRGWVMLMLYRTQE